MRRELLFGESREKAIDAGRSRWIDAMEGLRSLTLPGPLEWIADELRSGGYSRELPFIAGTPEECAEELVEYAQTGVDTVVIRMQSAGMDYADTLRAIERVGSEVLPLLRAAGY